MGGKPAAKGRRASYADLQALPDHRVGEIVDGELVVKPRPAPRHAHASSVLGMDLGGAFQRGRGGPGGWLILDEPELHLGPGPDILVPDLAGWRRHRLPELPDTAWFELSPDWVCEVLSAGTAAVDRADKMPIYAREAVAHVWLVDPTLETLEVYRRHEDDNGGWRLLATHRGDRHVRAEPFDAVDLDLGALWRP